MFVARGHFHFWETENGSDSESESLNPHGKDAPNATPTTRMQHENPRNFEEPEGKRHTTTPPLPRLPLLIYLYSLFKPFSF